MATTTDTVTIALPRDVAERVHEQLGEQAWTLGRSASDLLWALVGDALGTPVMNGMREDVRRAWGL